MHGDLSGSLLVTGGLVPEIGSVSTSGLIARPYDRHAFEDPKGEPKVTASSVAVIEKASPIVSSRAGKFIVRK